MKTNEMWKLDLLEVKFNASAPRFPHTRKLLRAKNNTKLLRKIPATPEEAHQQIAALKRDYFNRKWFAALKKLDKEVRKAVRSKAAPPFVEANIQTVVTAKLAKVVQLAMLTSKEARAQPPLYINAEVRDVLVNKLNPCNPSRFFIDHCQSDKALNNFISSMWNHKPVKQCLADIEWSFKVVRGGLTKEEREARKRTGRPSQGGESGGESGGDDSDDSSDSNDSDDSEDSDDSDDDDRIASGSDSEDALHNEASKSEADPLLADPLLADARLALPQLATGYFSGESDSDIDNDEVVKAATTQRKNRRGQRARQKIWEQKYGREAKHVKLEHQRYLNEREQKQKEYEERCRRREEKARLQLAPSGSNVLPVGERKVRGGTSAPAAPAAPAATPAVHPSWEAKRLAEERQKNAKFSGKKIVFD